MTLGFRDVHRRALTRTVKPDMMASTTWAALATRTSTVNCGAHGLAEFSEYSATGQPCVSVIRSSDASGCSKVTSIKVIDDIDKYQRRLEIVEKKSGNSFDCR